MGLLPESDTAEMVLPTSCSCRIILSLLQEMALGCVVESVLGHSNLVKIAYSSP